MLVQGAGSKFPRAFAEKSGRQPQRKPPRSFSYNMSMTPSESLSFLCPSFLELDLGLPRTSPSEVSGSGSVVVASGSPDCAAALFSPPSSNRSGFSCCIDCFPCITYLRREGFLRNGVRLSWREGLLDSNSGEMARSFGSGVVEVGRGGEVESSLSESTRLILWS